MTKSMEPYNKVVVDVPPGRLGIHLIDDADGYGAHVTSVNDDSPLAGAVVPGDRIVAINDVDVSDMDTTGKHKRIGSTN